MHDDSIDGNMVRMVGFEPTNPCRIGASVLRLIKPSIGYFIETTFLSFLKCSSPVTTSAFLTIAVA